MHAPKSLLMTNSCGQLWSAVCMTNEQTNQRTRSLLDRRKIANHLLRDVLA